MKRRALLFGALLLGALPATAFAQGKDVDIKAADGTLLKGTYFSAGRPGPGVLLFHMCNSERKAWTGLAPLVAKKGIHVLTLDYRGYGESGGPSYKNWKPEDRRRFVEDVWPGDLDRAFDFLVAQPGVDRQRIGAGGGSCGVNNSIQLARRHPEVKTLVLLAGGTNLAGEEFLGGAPWMPIFGAAARDDGGAVENIRWLLGFSSNPTNQMKVYENGGHGTEIFAVHKDLEPTIAAWFERHLVTQPVRATPGAAPKPGPSAQLSAKVREPGYAVRALAEARAARASGRRVTDPPPEGVINVLGYEHLQAGRAKEAIELFALNAELYPESANTYDSLSDGYLGANDRTRAVEYARKALDALARDTRAGESTKKAIRESAEAKLKDNK